MGFMKIKKILICTNAYPPNFIGGAELIAHQHAKILKKTCYDVAVYAGELNNFGKQYKVKQYVYEDIPVHRICLHTIDYSSDFIGFYNEKSEEYFDQLLAAYAPDVVHFHNIIGLSVGLIRLAKERNIKTVLTLHDYWALCHKNTLIRDNNYICEGEPFPCNSCRASLLGGGWINVPMSMRRDYIFSQLKYADAFISPSAYLAHRYIRAGVPSGKMKVIPNGIDIKRFSNIQRTADKDQVRFSYIGYLGHHKGVHTIIDALPYLSTAKKFRVNIVGDGEQKNSYKSQLKDTGCKDNVQFWGKVANSQIEKVYRETDVLILPSVWPENQPVSITEAMAARIPVIASRIGGIPELVDDEKTGYLFEPGNSRDLAQKMSACLSQDDHLQQLGENGYNKIAGLTFENQVALMTGIYETEQPDIERHTEQEDLILCIGRDINADCARVIEAFLDGTAVDYKFFISDWAGEEQIRKATLLWVVDSRTELSELKIAAHYKLPIIVPENNADLTALCRSNNCGLYYGNIHEAVECLKYLTENEQPRTLMGQNSSRFYSE
jgi:glycosyltransferase involved in cell wall biosynthesis